MASPSRITTRSTLRTSRAFAAIPNLRAAPTSARAASGPGQVISSAEDLPGSVNEPCAKNAPRHAASASHIPAETTCGGNPRIGRAFASISPACRARASPSETTRTTYRLPLRSPLGESTESSLSCPYISEISFRRRRAVCAVSSSTSITIFPDAICNPPANLRRAETSAFRQHGLVTLSRLNSSFTDAVIAMRQSKQGSLDNVCEN